MQWFLAIPQFFIVYALGAPCGALILIAVFTELFIRRIPRPLFDAIAMTFHYVWRAVSYAISLRAEYSPFDFCSGGR